MKILVVGDSYGLPRFDGQTHRVALSYQDTYPERLRIVASNRLQEDVVLLNRCQHANTTHTLISGEVNQIWFLNPQIVVIQLGIVDLWPVGRRHIAPLQPELLGKDPWVSNQEFKDNLKRFIECAVGLEAKVILVGIARISNGVLFKYPIVRERISDYNHTLSTICDETNNVYYLDWNMTMHQFSERALIGEDGIHLTVKGSTLLATKIFDLIEQITT